MKVRELIAVLLERDGDSDVFLDVPYDSNVAWASTSLVFVASGDPAAVVLVGEEDGPKSSWQSFDTPPLDRRLSNDHTASVTVRRGVILRLRVEEGARVDLAPAAGVELDAMQLLPHRPQGETQHHGCAIVGKKTALAKVQEAGWGGGDLAGAVAEMDTNNPRGGPDE